MIISCSNHSVHFHVSSSFFCFQDHPYFAPVRAAEREKEKAKAKEAMEPGDSSVNGGASEQMSNGVQGEESDRPMEDGSANGAVGA